MNRRRRIRTICERQHRSLRVWALSLLALVMLIVTNTCDAHADSITDIESTLTSDSTLPLGPGIAQELAQNLWDAQLASPYSWETDSLVLSITAVLRAIALEQSLAGATAIDSPALEPLPFLQSTIAIDDRVSVSITPPSIDFGPQLVEIPEPGLFLLTVAGLVAVGFLCHLRFGKDPGGNHDDSI
jgi:hypothetical protein